MDDTSLSHLEHGNDAEEKNPLLSSTTAVSTSPFMHHATIARSNFLAEKQEETHKLETNAHKISAHNTILLFFWNTYSHIIIYVTMLVTLESIVGVLLTVGATLIAWYSVPSDDLTGWNGNLPTVMLSFAVITPLSQSITMGFTRRETALKALAKYRSAVYNLYVAHSSWDWSACHKNKGRRGCLEDTEDEVAVYGNDTIPAGKKQKSIDFLAHSDTTLCHLIHLSDSLYKYLTLPNATRARHRVTSKGINEANEILSTGRDIFTFNLYGQMIVISELCEALKYRGMPGNEASRVRQWENMITNAMEDLRVVKEYRTLQALRVFGRLCSLLLPPFYATMYVQLAIDTNSLAMGIALGVLTSLALTGLFECVKQIEDPFVSHVTLDAIDVREELVVLAFQELMVARKMLFPEAEAYVMKPDCGMGKESGSRSKAPVEKGFGIADRMSRHTAKEVGAMS